MKHQKNSPKGANGKEENGKPSIYKLLQHHLTPALCGLALLVAFIVMITFEKHYLFRIQELNLFLPTPLFLKQQLVVAGGLLTYVGTWFTQFFYHQWMGALLLCLWCGLLAWMTKKTFHLSDKWGALLLIPIACILLTDFELGYWIFYLKLRGHFFITVIGSCTALALVWLYNSLPQTLPFRLAYLLLTGVIAYPLLGAYGLAATVLMAVVSWRTSLTLTAKLTVTLAALLLFFMVPLAFYRTLYVQANQIYIWTQALPNFTIEETYYIFYLPYFVLALFFIAAAASYREKAAEEPLRKPLVWTASQVVLLATVAFGTYHFWYKDSNYHKELAMNDCIERLDWEGVLDIARSETDEPTRLMVMNKNLALFKLGRGGNEMYRYKDGAKAPDCPFTIRMMQVGGKILYLNYGRINFCYRWCLEDGVEFGWRVDYYKYLLRCSILNGETKVAKKYIDILKQTRYYREWAEKYEPYLTHPELIAQDKELSPITDLMGYRDNLDSDNSLIEMYLLNIFGHQQTNNPVFSDLVLMAALQLKDIPTFWKAFTQYAILHPNEHMPTHYQEAAFMYGNLERNVDISKMPFDKEIIQSYQEFMALANQCAGMTEEQMKPVFYPRFGATFFYNYFLMRNMQSY